jgi:manganese efflux pump family protein
VNLFEIALISIALAFNTSGICFRAASSPHKSDAGILLRMLFLLVTFQLLFSFAGLLLGKVISSVNSSVIHWIALSLMIMMGIKILFESFQGKPEYSSFNITDLKVVFRLSIAASIDPFVIFSGIGLLLPNIPDTLLLEGITFLLFISAWLIAGRKKGTDVFKLRLRPLGGLILLGAGLHLFIKLIR